MNTLNHFDHFTKVQNKEHFSHLIQVALADGAIDETERKMLHRLGRKLNFTDNEIDSFIEVSMQAAYAPHHELSKRFEQMYDIIKIVLADGKIGNNEMRMATSLAIKSGFHEHEIPSLLSLLILGIREGADDEELFEKYKNERKRSIIK